MRNVPEWTKGNAFAKRFFKWLRKKNKPALLTWENVFTKTFNREFTFVYMGTNLENRASHLYQGMEFVKYSGRKKFPVPAWMYALPGTEGSGICPKETGERKKGYCDHRS